MRPQNKILDRGYKALIDALGFDGMIRFLRQFEPGSGDYTKERHQWLDQFTVEDIFTQTEQAREKTLLIRQIDEATPGFPIE